MPEQAALEADAPIVADFTRSIPPTPPIFRARLSASLSELAANPHLDMLVRTSASGGTPSDQEAGLKWLEPKLGDQIATGRMTVTNGTQGAVLLLLEALVGQNGLLLTEALSWGALREIGRRAHVRIKGLPIDDDGIIPDAFEAACRDLRPKALYCNPTDQNPTTAIMSETRRRQIAEIARHYGVAIIEDDALGRLHPGSPAPIASIAPDITWYVMGLTKCVAQGLRLAYVAGPSVADTQRVIGPAHKLSFWAPNPLTTAIATRWIGDGTAEEICTAIRHESKKREELASSLLSGADLVSKPGAMHVWLRLPPEQDRHQLVASLKDKGVAIRPAELFAVDDTPVPNAVRLSLSSPLDRSHVEQGLRIIAAALKL
ncbi:aminotransferase-like domain-containing protein [Rhizobium miluonense]|uniref:DNA-binding transcriptional regulator, MocR family, contains an aminotransferase domain n=1 Tax=Rhizobium miluonense TaxID=411945 RepID=A0A1C3WDB0_9HYPH|nr:PLP-dependent aminotransferase family protein [Rhizobium miluonense]SCB38039.1 DNA-binding transcriptional regulator, MocR family, contains an aminotransferase domain [Rhizobium miluonense]